MFISVVYGAEIWSLSQVELRMPPNGRCKV